VQRWRYGLPFPRVRDEVLKVIARSEPIAVAVQDHHPDIGVGFALPDCLRQRGVHGGSQGVLFFWTVDRNAKPVPLQFGLHFAHILSPAARNRMCLYRSGQPNCTGRKSGMR